MYHFDIVKMNFSDFIKCTGNLHLVISLRKSLIIRFFLSINDIYKSNMTKSYHLMILYRTESIDVLYGAIF